MKKYSILTGLLTLSLVACGAKAPAEPEVISLGFIGPLTGDAAAYGTDTLNGTLLRIAEVNAAGGINGKQVELIAEDGKCAGSEAAGAAQKLVNIDKVDGIIGGVCSGETLAAAPIAGAKQLVMISPVSTSPDVTDAGDFVFRTVPSDDLKTKAMANYFSEQGWDKVAIISEQTDFCTAFENALKKDVGEEKFVFSETVEPGSKDFRTLLTRLKDEEFDVLVANGNSVPVIGSMLEQMRELGFTQTAITHDAGETADIFEVAPLGSEGLLAINVPSIGNDTAFGQKFIAKNGPAQSTMAFAGAAYDATTLLLNAIESVGTEGTAIRDYLYNVSAHDGAIGTFGFDENGDVKGINFKLSKATNGSFEKIADITVE